MTTDYIVFCDVLAIVNSVLCSLRKKHSKNLVPARLRQSQCTLLELSQFHSDTGPWTDRGQSVRQKHET